MQDQVRRITHKIINAMNAVLDNMEDRARPTPAGDPVLAPLLRATANALGLWPLCACTACRRARCCRGKPSECVARYGPLTPPDLRADVMATLRARRAALSQEAMRAQGVPW